MMGFGDQIISFKVAEKISKKIEALGLKNNWLAKNFGFFCLSSCLTYGTGLSKPIPGRAVC